MSSTPNPSPDGTTRPFAFTEAGLPLDQTHLGAAIATAHPGDGGPARRIDCRPPQLISAPLIQPSKRPPLDARRTLSLTVGPTDSSLIDDDDDEVIDYFDLSGRDSAPIASLAVDAYPVPSSSRWNVREHNVPALPSFYPLEKSSVFIPQASAPVLAARIAAALQSRSIAASFDAQNAKVDCVSKSHVEFRVRLYRGREDYNHGIIVEVQRRFGFDLSYTQDVFSILDAAEGKEPQDDQAEITPMHYCNEDSSISCDEEDVDSLENTAGFAALHVIQDILCPQDAKAGVESAVEGRDFALSSLASLTSLECMGQAARQLSNELLTSEIHADLRRVVFSHVGQDPLNHAPQRPMLLSLEILANVSASAHSPTQLVDLLSANEDEILLKLITNVESAVLNPRAADLSCVVLKNGYISQTTEMPSSPCKERLLAALMKAVGHGGECHADLERHSLQCLELM